MMKHGLFEKGRGSSFVRSLSVNQTQDLRPQPAYSVCLLPTQIFEVDASNRGHRVMVTNSSDQPIYLSLQDRAVTGGWRPIKQGEVQILEDDYSTLTIVDGSSEATTQQ